MSLFLKGRDLLTIGSLSDREISEILSFARDLKSRSLCGEELPLLSGVQIHLYDPDRVMPAWDPFALAISQLGGQAHTLDPGRINLAWNETYLDIFAQLDRVSNGLAIASVKPGEGESFMEDVAELMGKPVLNMMSNRAAPFQALASYMTLQERLGEKLHDMTAAICWAPPGLGSKPQGLPISLAELLIHRGLNVQMAFPSEFVPGDDLGERMETLVPGALQMTDSSADAIDGADLVFSLNWSSTEGDADPAEVSDVAKRHADWCLTADRFSLAAPGALLGGGVPQGRGVEIDAELLELPAAIHLEESENLLHMVKAIMAFSLDLSHQQQVAHE